MEQSTQIPELSKTDQSIGSIPPAFDLFVRLKNTTFSKGGFVYHSEFSKATGKREFTYRGDKFTKPGDNPLKQLVNLKTLAARLVKTGAYAFVMIRDRRISSIDPADYCVLKWNILVDAEPEINRIPEYLQSNVKP